MSDVRVKFLSTMEDDFRRMISEALEVGIKLNIPAETTIACIDYAIKRVLSEMKKLEVFDLEAINIMSEIKMARHDDNKDKAELLEVELVKLGWQRSSKQK